MAFYAKLAWDLALALDAAYSQPIAPRRRREDTSVEWTTPTVNTAPPLMQVATGTVALDGVLTGGSTVTLPTTTVQLIIVENTDATNFLYVSLTYAAFTNPQHHRVGPGKFYINSDPGAVTAMKLVADTAAIKARVVVIGIE